MKTTIFFLASYTPPMLRGPGCFTPLGITPNKIAVKIVLLVETKLYSLRRHLAPVFEEGSDPSKEPGKSQTSTHVGSSPLLAIAWRGIKNTSEV
jgi:hypothetical protein